NNKEGDVGAIMPTYTTDENEKLTRQVKEYAEQTVSSEASKQFWGQNQGTPTVMGSVTGQTMINMAKVGPKGVDPMGMLHRGVKEGKIPTPKQMQSIVAKADMK